MNRLVWDLLVAAALVAAHAWLAVLTARLRSVHRRLALHLTRGGGRHAIRVDELLRRERRIAEEDTDVW